MNDLTTGVPKQVFDSFFEALSKKKVSTDVIERFRKTLTEQGDISEAAMRSALFTDNPEA